MVVDIFVFFRESYLAWCTLLLEGLPNTFQFSHPTSVEWLFHTFTLQQTPHSVIVASLVFTRVKQFLYIFRPLQKFG